MDQPKSSVLPIVIISAVFILMLSVFLLQPVLLNKVQNTPANEFPQLVHDVFKFVLIPFLLIGSYSVLTALRIFFARQYPVSGMWLLGKMQTVTGGKAIFRGLLLLIFSAVLLLTYWYAVFAMPEQFQTWLDAKTATGTQP